MFFAIAANAQNPLSVGYQKRIQLPIAGATAAYSLDSTIADASAANGIVEIVGKGPGSANIVVVTPAGAQTIAVAGAERWAATATLRKVAMYADGCWLHGYQEPFIS